MGRKFCQQIHVGESTFESHRPCEFKIDQKYQRNEVTGWIKWLAENFNKHLIGVPVLACRPNKDLYVLDGQQRSAAAKIVGADKDEFLCRVIRGLTLEQEAAMFYALQKVKPVIPPDKYRARLASGEVAIVEIQNAVNRAKLSIGRTRDAKVVTAVLALEWAHTHCHNLLVTLTTLRDWSEEIFDDPWCYDLNCIRWVSRFLCEHSAAVDPSVLSRKLTQYVRHSDAKRVIGSVKSYQRNEHVSLPEAANFILTRLYNNKNRHPVGSADRVILGERADGKENDEQ